MTEKMLLRKTCNIYANDLHFAAVMFPFISKEIKSNKVVRTILEKNEQENIEKIIKNVGLNSEIKEKIKKIDWKNCNIKKIRENFKLLDMDIKNNLDTDIIVLGSNIFIQKVNKAMDLWVKNNITKLEKSKSQLNIINCFSFDENKEINPIINSHEYILKTSGLEEIEIKEELLKAN